MARLQDPQLSGPRFPPRFMRRQCRRKHSTATHTLTTCSPGVQGEEGEGEKERAIVLRGEGKVRRKEDHVLKGREWRKEEGGKRVEEEEEGRKGPLVLGGGEEERQGF